MLKNNPKEKFILMLQIIERTKKEKTSYGKLLFQENAISHSIIATLKTIALCLNTDNLSLNLNFNLDIFEDRVPTLGGLANILFPYLESYPDIKKEIKEYIKLRNDLTHNMFLNYNDISKIDLDSEKVVKSGQTTLTLLGKLRDKIRNDYSI